MFMCPENAKPGTYAIGQISLLSTSCELSAIKDIYTNSPINNQNCQSWPNGSRTSFYMGNLSKDFGSSSINAKQWNGYVNPLVVQMEVTAADPLEAPKIEEGEINPSTIEFRYLYSNEQNCTGSVSAGELAEDKLIKDGYWTLKAINLKPSQQLLLSCLALMRQAQKLKVRLVLELQNQFHRHHLN
jgi:hypothetical protein